MSTTMTKQNFVAIAKTIRELPLMRDDKATVAVAFANMLEDTNVRFDRGLFLAACRAD